ncbi:MAG: TetR/AcrR family transcriptional regulator [Myxococcota bacterium]
MGRRIQQKAETRARICVAAHTVFTTGDPQDASIKAIASAAGVSPGTIYVHFPDRTALMLAAFEDELMVGMADAWASLPGSDLRAQLLHLGGAALDWGMQRPKLAPLLLAAAIARPALALPKATVIEDVARVFEIGQLRRMVRANLDSVSAAQAFVGIVAVAVSLPPARGRESLPKLIDTLMGGLAVG